MCRKFMWMEDFNPRSPCGERLLPSGDYTDKDGISIHAPRAGSDEDGLLVTDLDLISIHAPRAGSDSDAQHAGGGCENFNPRSPCGERQVVAGHCVIVGPISIHAPRAGSDSEDAQNGTVYFEQLS